MRYTKIIFFLVIYFIGTATQPVKAQSLNINGDTILINMEAEVQIIFPASPANYSTIPANTQYLIWNVKTGLYLIPATVDYSPVTLLVSEAGRMHRFILQFKQDISNSEAKLYYDYSTVSKLAQHLRGKPAAPSTLSKRNIQPVENDTKKATMAVAEEPATALKGADSSIYYYSLLEQGEKELSLQNYREAALNFDRAHLLRPADPYPLKRLREIKTSQAEKEKSAQAEQDRKINEMLSKANIAKSEKAVPKKQFTGENNYDIAVTSADNFFKNGNYDSAKVLYSKALIFKRTDWPREQINKINKILNERAIEENKRLAKQLQIALAARLKNDSSLPAIKVKPAIEIKTTDVTKSASDIKGNYTVALLNGRASYKKNDLINAKAYYEEAIKLQPLQQEPMNQLKSINKKLEAIARENEITNNYDRNINLADSLVNAKAFESAVIWYKEAASLKPTEAYPKKQLKYMQSELALKAKRENEEKERKYNEALTMADKAVADKKYVEAISGYTEALSLHPENEYAKRRLEIISYQVEKARSGNVRADTVKETIPVKKSKRKKS